MEDKTLAWTAYSTANNGFRQGLFALSVIFVISLAVVLPGWQMTASPVLTPENALSR
jgi:hypothetical protein